MAARSGLSRVVGQRAMGRAPGCRGRGGQRCKGVVLHFSGSAHPLFVIKGSNDIQQKSFVLLVYQVGSPLLPR